MTTVKGENGQEYELRGPKPVQQALEEKWFSWLSDDAALRAGMQLEVETGTSIKASWGKIEDKLVDQVKGYVDDLLCSPDFLMRDLTQLCEDYTDWRHLTRRLISQFGLEMS